MACKANKHQQQYCCSAGRILLQNQQAVQQYSCTRVWLVVVQHNNFTAALFCLVVNTAVSLTMTKGY